MALIAGALAALAMWPWFAAHTVTAGAQALPPAAPLRNDALIRSATIAFEEKRERVDADDQITPRMLSAQYLQRYRERGDVGDILRARGAALRSLHAQPQGNVAALQALSAAQLALHHFREARATIRRARVGAENQPALAMTEASLDLELGDMRAAHVLIQRFASDPASQVVTARFDELTGHLDVARSLLAHATEQADVVYGVPNERRAWFHARLGELAFESGDVVTAKKEEAIALERFPDDVVALTDTARFAAATGDWTAARAGAQRAVLLTPSPENLGLLADAQLAGGDAAGAAATRDAIDAVARIGNSEHLVDRLLALYYADHNVHLDEAYAIARRELAIRDDVYAEDTLAWTAARDGHWDVARVASARAMAWGVADSRVAYHAGVIAQHARDERAANTDFTRALALNPTFAAEFADDARARLAASRSRERAGS